MRAFRRSIQINSRRRGVALIITLGLLSVLTLLAVAFAIAMRVESMAARNYANMIRSKHLVRNGLALALDDIRDACEETTYPDWMATPPPGWPAECITTEALGSYGSGVEVDLMQGEVTRAIPPILLADSEAVTTYWRDIVITNRQPLGTTVVQTNGRVAYAIINCSGLLDANYIGGSTRDISIDPVELDITHEIPDDATFYAERDEHRRYETLQELYAINSATDPYVASNLFTHSLDVGRESYFQNTNQLGYFNCVLLPKFNINAATNYPRFGETIPPGSPPNMRGLATDTAFMNNYWRSLRGLLASNIYERTTRADDVAWNIVNYLDEDRIPESNEAYPWRNTEGGEPTPLINEIAIEPAGSANQYVFKVELWYPFAPRDVDASDNFKIQIGVFKTNWPSSGAPNEWNIMDSSTLPADHLIMIHQEDITDMEFGTSTEYLVFTTPPFSARIPSEPLSSSNAVWFLCRVLQDVGASKLIPVDEAMGYQQSEEHSQRTARRALKKFDAAPVGYMINDPRVNGQCRYWDPDLDGGTADNIGLKYGQGTTRPYTWNTLGRYNGLVCNAWSSTEKSQGLPVYAPTNSMMHNISELGHIFRSNLDDEFPNEADARFRFWRTIDLMNKKEGAALMDFMNVYPTNVTRRGLVTINTRQRDTLYTLFHNLNIANPGEVNPPPTATEINRLVDEIIYKGPYMHWRDMFDAGTLGNPASPGSDGGPVAVAMRGLCAHLGLPNVNDIMQEAAARAIVELISFRQNIFVIVVAAQTYGRNGHTVVGEQRGIATIIRDSYTGRYFIRNFKWLTD